VTKELVYRSQNFVVSLEYLFDDNMSNLAAFDYNRHVITTSLTWKF
jgi:5'(3')-deoxyribonucleotidase